MSHYKPYPAYRDGGVEWLGGTPEHWVLGKVKNRYGLQLGKMLQPRQEDALDVEVPYLRAYNVGWETVQTDDIATMWANPKELAQYEALPGDLLVCEGGEVGRAAILPTVPAFEGPLIIQNALHRVRARDGARERFLLYLLQIATTSGWLDVMCNKATIAHFTGDKLANLSVAYPPMEEMDGILNFLDAETANIDKLIEKKTLFIDLLKLKRQALITQAVTKGLDPNVKMKDSGVEWIGEVPAHWTVLQLGKVATDRCDGPFGSGLKSEHYSDSGVRVIRLQNIGPDVFRGDDAVFISEDYHQNSLGGGHDVVQGDLLLAGLGDDNNLLGRACVAPDLGGPAMVKADCFRFRLDQNKVNPSFISNQLSATAAHECGLRATGATRSRLNLGLATARVIAIPSVEEQGEIMEYLSQSKARLNLLVEKSQESITLLKERRTALITAAITGQIDLREDIA